MDFTGSTALVTGGGRGIGAAVARRLGFDGANVVINYRADGRAADSVAADIQARGGSAVTARADVTVEGAAAGLVQSALDRFGGLDILVSNAGIEHFGELSTITAADVGRVLATNVTAQLMAAQAAAAAMTGGGVMVLTSSVSRRLSVFHHAVYAASKAGVAAMVRNLAPELGERGIRINAIAPGGTRTDMAARVSDLYTPPRLRDLPVETQLRSSIALGRLAEPEEIAAAVEFLCSPGASYITGTTLEADGGMA